MTAKYLRANVRVEPLVNRWYAVAQLLSPHSFALQTARAQLPILRSYARAPKTHVAALRHPEMLGGPYVDYGGAYVSEVQRLIEHTEDTLATHLEFARALEELHKTLAARGDPASLAPMYNAMPSALRGKIELVYDAMHNCSVRPLEGMMYRGELSTTPLQAIRLQLAENDVRPFVFSTPRVDDEGLVISIPFASAHLDSLFAARTTPIRPASLAEALGIQPSATWDRLFTDQAPVATREGEAYPRMTYFGHASVLLESHSHTVLVDPWIPGPIATDPARRTIADLPERIDTVLITHAHADHFVIETLLQLRHRVGRIIVPQSGGMLADVSLRRVLGELGFKEVIEVAELDHLRFGDVEIVSLPFLGEHADLDIRAKAGYRITLEGHRVMCVADSNVLDESLYRALAADLGPVDTLCVGLECRGAPLSWVYAPYLFKTTTRQVDQSRRLDGCDCTRASQMAQAVGCKRAFVYALGLEPWTRHIVAADYDVNPLPIREADAFIERCRGAGVEGARLEAGMRFQLT